MPDITAGHTVFYTLVKTEDDRSRVRLLIDSLRAFGGDLKSSPVWVFEADPSRAPCKNLEAEDVRIFPLLLPDTVRQYYFASKVYAAARAEEMAPEGLQSLVWTASDCLFINPPVLFDLEQSFDAAVRPVHIKNVGQPPEEKPDGFWRGIYSALGVDDIRTTVETFAGGERVRSYFNSHAFAVNPARGVLRRWFEIFEALVRDDAYQENACHDEGHRIFLHQAVFSALLVSEFEASRIRELPPEYNYPYNLQSSVPPERRASVLNSLVSITFEDRSLDPDRMDDIEVHEPLRSWLAGRGIFGSSGNP